MELANLVWLRSEGARLFGVVCLKVFVVRVVNFAFRMRQGFMVTSKLEERRWAGRPTGLEAGTLPKPVPRPSNKR